MRFVIKSIATFCLLLTIWSAVGFAAHHHSSSTESAKCTVCVAAHTAALGGYLFTAPDDPPPATARAARTPAARMGGAIEVRPIVEW